MKLTKKPMKRLSLYLFSQASMFGEKIYWKINRKNGVAGLYSASNNKMVSEKIICKTRPGL